MLTARVITYKYCRASLKGRQSLPRTPGKCRGHKHFLKSKIITMTYDSSFKVEAMTGSGKS